MAVTSAENISIIVALGKNLETPLSSIIVESH
jgi:hypothetical protein